eukprot:2050584-Prymnesium_polylepis.1
MEEAEKEAETRGYQQAHDELDAVVDILQEEMREMEAELREAASNSDISKRALNAAGNKVQTLLREIRNLNIDNSQLTADLKAKFNATTVRAYVGTCVPYFVRAVGWLGEQDPPGGWPVESNTARPASPHGPQQLVRAADETSVPSWPPATREGGRRLWDICAGIARTSPWQQFACVAILYRDRRGVKSRAGSHDGPIDYTDWWMFDGVGIDAWAWHQRSLVERRLMAPSEAADDVGNSCGDCTWPWQQFACVAVLYRDRRGV